MKARTLPIFVVLAVAMLVGHICTLPAEAEWVSGGAPDSSAPADHHDSDGSHIASCEATVSKAAPECSRSAGALWAALTIVAVDPAGPTPDVVPETPLASRRAPDRSLFLLHASFLI